MGNLIYTHVAAPPGTIVLSRIISPEYTAANPGLAVQMPKTKGVGTVMQTQIQAAGGPWTTLLVNTSSTLNATQNEYEKVVSPQGALPAGNKEARVIVDGIYSNVIAWTV